MASDYAKSHEQEQEDYNRAVALTQAIQGQQMVRLLGRPDTQGQLAARSDALGKKILEDRDRLRSIVLNIVLVGIAGSGKSASICSQSAPACHMVNMFGFDEGRAESLEGAWPLPVGEGSEHVSESVVELHPPLPGQEPGSLVLTVVKSPFGEDPEIEETIRHVGAGEMDALDDFPNLVRRTMAEYPLCAATTTGAARREYARSLRVYGHWAMSFPCVLIDTPGAWSADRAAALAPFVARAHVIFFLGLRGVSPKDMWSCVKAIADHGIAQQGYYKTVEVPLLYSVFRDSRCLREASVYWKCREKAREALQSVIEQTHHEIHARESVFRRQRYGQYIDAFRETVDALPDGVFRDERYRTQAQAELEANAKRNLRSRAFYTIAQFCTLAKRCVTKGKRHRKRAAKAFTDEFRRCVTLQRWVDGESFALCPTITEEFVHIVLSNFDVDQTFDLTFDDHCRWIAEAFAAKFSGLCAAQEEMIYNATYEQFAATVEKKLGEEQTLSEAEKDVARTATLRHLELELASAFAGPWSEIRMDIQDDWETPARQLCETAARRIAELTLEERARRYEADTEWTGMGEAPDYDAHTESVTEEITGLLVEADQLWTKVWQDAVERLAETAKEHVYLTDPVLGSSSTNVQELVELVDGEIAQLKDGARVRREATAHGRARRSGARARPTLTTRDPLPDISGILDMIRSAVEETLNSRLETFNLDPLVEFQDLPLECEPTVVEDELTDGARRVVDDADTEDGNKAILGVIEVDILEIDRAAHRPIIAVHCENPDVYAEVRADLQRDDCLPVVVPLLFATHCMHASTCLMDGVAGQMQDHQMGFLWTLLNNEYSEDVSRAPVLLVTHSDFAGAVLSHVRDELQQHATHPPNIYLIAVSSSTGASSKHVSAEIRNTARAHGLLGHVDPAMDEMAALALLRHWGIPWAVVLDANLSKVREYVETFDASQFCSPPRVLNVMRKLCHDLDYAPRDAIMDTVREHALLVTTGLSGDTGHRLIMEMLTGFRVWSWEDIRTVFECLRESHQKAQDDGSASAAESAHMEQMEWILQRISRVYHTYRTIGCVAVEAASSLHDKVLQGRVRFKISSVPPVSNHRRSTYKGLLVVSPSAMLQSMCKGSKVLVPTMHPHKRRIDSWRLTIGRLYKRKAIGPGLLHLRFLAHVYTSKAFDLATDDDLDPGMPASPSHQHHQLVIGVPGRVEDQDGGLRSDDAPYAPSEESDDEQSDGSAEEDWVDPIAGAENNSARGNAMARPRRTRKKPRRFRNSPARVATHRAGDYE